MMARGRALLLSSFYVLLRLEELMEEAKPKDPLRGLAFGAAPSFPSGSKALR